MGFSYAQKEVVVQKQKMLKDAIEATKEKLATLKTAAQQANEQLANGEITQQQYDALPRGVHEFYRGCLPVPEKPVKITGKFTEDRLIKGWLYGNMKIK